MTVTPIDAPLPPSAVYGVLVDGTPVYKTTRNGWRLGTDTCKAIWADIQARIPTVCGERILHGCIAAAGYDGVFTRPQLDAFTAEILRLKAAASRSEHAKAQREARKSYGFQAAL